MDNVITTKLFETDGVSVFRIPPGHHSLKKWNINGSNIVWSGNLRAIEQEVLNDGSDSFGTDNQSHDPAWSANSPSQQKDIMPPHKGLRLKLELYNVVSIPPSVGNLTTVRKDATWAEVWYNPTPSVKPNDDDDRYDSDDDSRSRSRKSLEYSIANDGEETIQMTPESPKFYKIIAQLPGSGYHPYDSQAGELKTKDSDDEEPSLVQIALGLKFDESFSAVSFAESLGIYKRRFRNFEDQYKYEMKLSQIEMKSQNLSLNDRETGDDNDKSHAYNFNDDDDNDDDDDDDANDLNFYEKNGNLFSRSPHIASSTSGSDNLVASNKDGQSNRNRANSAATSITVPDDESVDRAYDIDDSSHEDNDEDDDDFGDFVQSA